MLVGLNILVGELIAQCELVSETIDSIRRSAHLAGLVVINQHKTGVDKFLQIWDKLPHNTSQSPIAPRGSAYS